MAVTSLTPRSAVVSAKGWPDETQRRSMLATATALEAALKLRAPCLYVTTPMVRELAMKVSRQIGLDEGEQALVDVSVRVRDIGMIGLPDSLILKPGLLGAGDGEALSRHAVLGAELLRTLPDMMPVAEIVRAHHERWDGTGYPDGLRQDAIPLPSRVIAVCDAFVRISSDRTHRSGIGADAALERIRHERGSEFDPELASCLLTTLTKPGTSAEISPSGNAKAPSAAVWSSGGPTPGRIRDLRCAIAELDAVPAFGPAHDRASGALAASIPTSRSELIEAIECDAGLTIAILQRAQVLHRSHPITSVPAAVSVLDEAEIAAALAAVPRAAFPWQTRFEGQLHAVRVHAHAVVRAAERLAQLIKPDDRDAVTATALLHDIGKLVLVRARADYTGASDARSSPEDRLRHEQRAFGIDHASLGGLMLERWGMPHHVVSAVSGHHGTSEDPSAGRFLRLADMVAHHAQGGAVNRELMLHLAADFGVAVSSLYEVLFRLPQVPGTRRRTDPSPLSRRETAILGLVAEGKRAAQIAREMNLSVSTVRSHLHNVYGKLEVPDRAQAVLLAQDRTWI